MSLEGYAVLGECLSQISSKHLASTVGIHNLPEGAHRSGSAEGQCPAAPLSLTRWAGAVGEGHQDEDGANPTGKYLAWRDPESGSWLLGHEVSRDEQ